MTSPEPSPAVPGAVARWLLDRLLAGRLPRPVARWAVRKLDEDERWAAYYDEQRALERALEGGAPLSGAQRAGLLGAVLDGVEAPEAAAAPGRVWAGAAVAAAVAIAVVVVVPAVQKRGDDERWRPRGSDATVGIKARCLEPGGARVLAEAEAGNKAPLRAPVLTCPRSAAVAFAATNTGERALEYAVVGVSSSGELRFYAPFVRDARSATAPAGVVDDLPSVAATLADLPVDERVALFVVFRDEPFSVGELADAAARARRSGASPRTLGALPVESVVQARIDLQMPR